MRRRTPCRANSHTPDLHYCGGNSHGQFTLNRLPLRRHTPFNLSLGTTSRLLRPSSVSHTPFTTHIRRFFTRTSFLCVTTTFLLSYMMPWIGTHKSPPFLHLLQPLTYTRHLTCPRNVPSLQEKVSFHWPRPAKHDGLVILEPHSIPRNLLPVAWQLFVNPHSFMKNAVQVTHDSPLLLGGCFQIMAFWASNVGDPQLCSSVLVRSSMLL